MGEQVDKLDELYKIYDVLVKAEKEGKLEENEGVFGEIIGRAATGDNQEKRLVSQFIAKFFKHFANLEIKAIEAQIELCDDSDDAVRKQAIHDLPSFCAKGADDPYIPRVAIVLCQLLTGEDKTELSIVEKSLNTLLRQSVTATIKGVLGQMTSSLCEDNMRAACIKFLCSKINMKSLDKDTETMMLEEAQKVCPVVGGEEFIHMLKLLSALKISKLVVNQQVLLKMIADQAQITKNTPFDSEHLVKLKTCIPLALPFFSPFAPSFEFISHIVHNAVPAMEPSQTDSLDLLKLVAQMAPHAMRPTDDEDDEVKAKMEVVLRILFDKVLDLVPPVPADDSLEKEPDLPTLHLSHLECLLFSFHSMTRKIKASFLENEELLKDIRQRLQYLARGLQVEAKKLKSAISEGTKLEEDKKSKAILALKTTSNLTAFIKDWFHNPPNFKTTLTLSWLQTSDSKPTFTPATPPTPTNGASVRDNQSTNLPLLTVTGSSKRKAIVYDKGDADDGSQAKKSFRKVPREIYKPPRGGKFRSGRW